MHQMATPWREIYQQFEDNDHLFLRVDFVIGPFIGFISLETLRRFRRK
jgi:hypothetical protein